MTFWQDVRLEPKRSYRFRLSIAGEKDNIKEFLVEKVGKPGFSINESEVKYLNHTFYYPGRVTWGDVKFTITDCLRPVEANATAIVMKMLEESGYNMPEGGDGGLRTLSKAASKSALGQVKIHQYLAEGGEPMETWVLNNAWIKDVQFGELDYGSDDMQKVDVTLKYDNAYIERPGQQNLPSGFKS